MAIYLYSALILGLAGNLHCIGMCGPIALAIPIKRSGKFRRFFSVLFYNSGRILMYATIGLVIGLFGKGFSILGFQQKLSVFVGVLLISSLLLPYLSRKIIQQRFFGLKRIGRLKSALQRRFKNPSFGSLFILGSLNALLPCGLVYTALAGAIVSGDPISGMLVMAVFGIGTLPVMFALPFFRTYIQQKNMTKVKRIIPICVFIMGSLFILRGANLGIPYLSPKADNSEIIKCH